MFGMQGPNLKGAIAEAKIAAAAPELDIPVLRPMAEHGRYDLAFEVGDRILRVQCKWGGLDKASGVIKVNLQSYRLTYSGYVRRCYTSDEIDCVAVYCGAVDRCYLLPSDLIAGRRAIYLRLTAARNSQRACINLASDYEFSGAVAQLGERRRGTPKATGSSPVSSIQASPRQLGTVVGAHQFRNHFGYYMERAAAGEEVLVTRRGRPLVRLSPAQGWLPIAA
jgi:prevent-host-death family protein